MKKTTWIRPPLACAFLVPALFGCGADNDPFVPPEPGNALIYTFPADGMVDVPLPTRALLVFSSRVDEAAVMENCTGSAEAPEGSFCVTGPDGPVPTADRTTLSNHGRTIEFHMEDLAPGTRYQVWVRQEAAPAAENLEDDTPLFSFTTRQANPVAGQPPAVLAINQDNPQAFLADSEVEARFPFVDVSPIRLTFTEPLDGNSLVLDDTLTLVRVNEDDSEETVPVDLLSERHYITLQPRDDLIPDAHYEVRLSDSIRDLNGEHLDAVTYHFEPRATKASVDAANPPIKQTLQTYPDMETAGYPGTSHLTGRALNQFTLENVALGKNVANSLPNGLEAFLADPQAFGGTTTPVMARSGQQLQLTGISPVKLGGEVKTDLDTGIITGTFLTNVTGYLTPNPYRPAGFQPDDERAPLYVYMNFDLALQTEDDKGNASLNQNLMHIQAVGIATIENRTLTMEVFRTLELDVLGGATRVSADFNLGARSDPDIPIDTTNPDAPRITGTFPANNQLGVETNENILLTFNEPLATAGLDEIRLLDMGSGGAEVPVQVKRSGTGLVVSPQERLTPATEYQLQISNLLTDIHAFNPRSLEAAPDDALAGTNTLTFTTADYTRTANDGEEVPPIILGLHPGIGCALTDTDKEDGKAGRCIGSKSDDALYLDFQYEIGRNIEATFSQPMDTDSMTLGTISTDGNACQDGPICVGENVNGNWQPVDASLVSGNLALDIIPADGAIQAGQTYRLVVNGDSTPRFYSHDELGHLALNTTPLEKMRKTATGNSEGGENIRIDFTAKAPFDTVYATVVTRPYSDFNGSGAWDEGEPEPASNFATAEVEGTDGLILSAEFADPNKDKIFATGALPMAFLPKQPLDLAVSDLGMVPQGNGTWCLPDPAGTDALGQQHCLEVEGDTMIPVEVNPQVILGTGLTVRANLGLPFPILDLIQIPLPLNTRSILLRIRPTGEPLHGYVVNLKGQDQPYFIVKLPAWLDAPDLDLLNALVEALTQSGSVPDFMLSNLVNAVADHNARSLAITPYLYGPIRFLDDSRITLKVTNLNNIRATLNVNLLPNLLNASAGSADLLLPSEGVTLQVMNHPSRARKVPEYAE